MFVQIFFSNFSIYLFLDITIMYILSSNLQHYGYSRITTNASTLVFEYVRDDDGKVHDSLVLQKWSYDYKLLLFNYLVIGLLWDILSTSSVKKKLFVHLICSEQLFESKFALLGIIYWRNFYWGVVNNLIFDYGVSANKWLSLARSKT